MGPGQQVQGPCDVLEGRRVACAPEAGQPGAGPQVAEAAWQGELRFVPVVFHRNEGTTLGLWGRLRMGDCRTSQGGVGAWETGQEGLQGLQQLGAILPFPLEPAEDTAPQEVCSCDPARGARPASLAQAGEVGDSRVSPNLMPRHTCCGGYWLQHPQG